MLGKTIRELRRSRSLSQQQLSNNICTKSMISQIENEKVVPSLALLERISSKLGVTIQELYSMTQKNSNFQNQLSDILDLITYKDYNSAIKSLKRLSRHQLDPVSLTDVFLLLGKCFYYQNDLNQSENTLLRALNIAKNFSLFPHLVKIHNSLSVIYTTWNNQDLSLEHLEQAIRYTENTEVSDRDLIKMKYNVSRLYRKKGQHTSALKIANEAIFLCEKSGIYECGGHLASIIGLIKVEQGYYKEGLSSFDKALRFYQFIDDQESIVGTYLNLAKTLFYIENYSEGERFLEKLSIIPSLYPYMTEEFVQVKQLYEQVTTR